MKRKKLEEKRGKRESVAHFLKRMDFKKSFSSFIKFLQFQRGFEILNASFDFSFINESHGLNEFREWLRKDAEAKCKIRTDEELEHDIQIWKAERKQLSKLIKRN